MKRLILIVLTSIMLCMVVSLFTNIIVVFIPINNTPSIELKTLKKNYPFKFRVPFMAIEFNTAEGLVISKCIYNSHEQKLEYVANTGFYITGVKVACQKSRV